MLATLLVLALSPASAAPAAPRAAAVVALRDDAQLRAQMELLGAGTAPEREAAQRWLAANLTTADYGLLAAGAREADVEASRRLVAALGADGAHLGLVILLNGEKEDALKELGRRAFEELVARWCPGAAERPVSRVAVNTAIVKSAARHFVDRPRAELARDAIDRLARLSDFELPLVITPDAAKVAVQSAQLDGGTLEAMTAVTRAGRLSYAGVGDWSGEHPGQGAWVLVTRSGGARSETGLARLRRWCLQVELERPEAADAARALAASAWPAALAWLESRWLERGDANALEGLLLAAQRGRVSLALQDERGRRELLRRADAVLSGGGDAGRVAAARIARALAAAPALGLGGEDGSMALFADWSELSPASRWVRLVVLEGTRSGRGDVQRRLLEIVEEELDAPPALRFQALRALAASPRLPLRAVRVDDAARLVGWALTRHLNGELLELFDALDVELDVAALGETDARRAFAAHWSLRRGRSDEVVRLLVEYASRREPHADLVAPRSSSWIAQMARWRLVEGRAALQHVAARALAELDGERRANFAAMALLAGGLDAAGERETFSLLKGTARPDALELELLGALCGGAVRRPALAELRRWLKAPPADAARREGLARGLDRAVHELLARRRDGEARELRDEVWDLARDEDHVLHDLLSQSVWPTRVGAVVVHLDLRERELPRELE